MVKRPLHVEFGPQQLTSYSGLERLRRYLRQHELPRRLRAACAATGGDYGGGRLARLVLALLYVGARRLERLRYVAGDPLIARFYGLARIPTARTVGNWLRQFTQATLGPLVLNHELVIDAVRRLALPRLTIDLDGTVVRTGATVGWAFRGFNPHHRKDPSYYPLLAHVAQTGHILRMKNRPGNVHDSKQSVAFLREVIDGLRTAFGRRLPLEFRMDAAFFQRDVLRLPAARACAYAIKVGYWHWLPLKQLAAEPAWLRSIPRRAVPWSAAQQEQKARRRHGRLDEEDEHVLRQPIDDALADVRSADHDRAKCEADQDGESGQHGSVLVGGELDDVHQDRGQRLGADVRALEQAVGEEEGCHERPHAAQERREQARRRADQGEASERGPTRRPGPDVSPDDNGNEEGAENARESRERRLREE
jgi:hypothetical protein